MKARGTWAICTLALRLSQTCGTRLQRPSGLRAEWKPGTDGRPGRRSLRGCARRWPPSPCVPSTSASRSTDDNWRRCPSAPSRPTSPPAPPADNFSSEAPQPAAKVRTGRRCPRRCSFALGLTWLQDAPAFPTFPIPSCMRNPIPEHFSSARAYVSQNVFRRLSRPRRVPEVPTAAPAASLNV